jgi:hypothetical protein
MLGCIARLTAFFEQHCDGDNPALVGSILRLTATGLVDSRARVAGTKDSYARGGSSVFLILRALQGVPSGNGKNRTLRSRSRLHELGIGRSSRRAFAISAYRAGRYLVRVKFAHASRERSSFPLSTGVQQSQESRVAVESPHICRPEKVTEGNLLE